MNYGYAYQRTGGPMTWRNGPPASSTSGRAAETVGLGSLSGDGMGSLGLDVVLPRPGAPEVMAVLGDCGCSGSGGASAHGKCGGTCDPGARGGALEGLGYTIDGVEYTAVGGALALGAAVGTYVAMGKAYPKMGKFAKVLLALAASGITRQLVP